MILAYLTTDSFYYIIGTFIIGFLLLSFIKQNKTAMSSSSSPSSSLSSSSSSAPPPQSSPSSSLSSSSNDNHNNNECVVYDSGDIAMLILQLSRDSSNIITIETALIIDILRFANILPNRKRMYRSSSLRYKTTYNENALYCSYNICSKSNIFMPTTITISINSKDQGWSSYPEEHGLRTSHTWGELSLNNNVDNRYFLYRNIHAGKNFEKQVIVFDASSPLINDINELMDTDDCVSINLHSRSQYPGWVHYIKEAHFEIQFDINTTQVLHLLDKYLLRK